MRIEHVALWTADLERSRRFYQQYFGGIAGEKYVNTSKGFESYFLVFQGGTRLELMQMTGIAKDTPGESLGWAHIAFSVGSREDVDDLTERLRADNYTVAGEPRLTGDGYYESIVLDPDGNRVEITI